MNHWPELLLFLLAPALLIAAICSGTDTTSGNCDFGGPYPFGGLESKAIPEKLRDFQSYSTNQLFLSTTTPLEDMDQLEDSIIKNLRFPKDDRRYRVLGQVYNYVITLNCDIIVATWNDSGVAELKRDIGSKKILTGKVCEGGTNIAPQVVVQGSMINWAPEEPYGSALANDLAPQSPCWLLPDKGKLKKGGVLDAISKHFMLAQGKDTTIAKYDEDTWKATKVAYAGEILVDLTTCTYIVVENSGTYRPLSEFNSAVNQFFAKELGRDSRKISNVEPWC